MGQRRMFSKDIVRSDSFLDLPLTAQCLYFQLGMETDDRGYISNGKSIVRLLGASQGDLEILILKKFLLVRHDGTLLLQKHFKTNNLIRTDRFHETNYTEDLSKLFYDENNNYTDKNTGNYVLGIPMVGKVETEDKISKVKISKDKLEIKLNKTRYKQFSLIEKLQKCGYFTDLEIQDMSFDQLLDNFVSEHGLTDTKIKVQYFIETTCELNQQGVYEFKREDILDKYNYLRISLEHSFSKPNIN